MDDDRGGYRAYLVRFWNAGSPAAPRWRASIQDVQTGERRGFADVARLCVYLAERFTRADAEDAQQLAADQQRLPEPAKDGDRRKSEGTDESDG